MSVLTGPPQKSHLFQKLDFEIYTYSDSSCDELQSGIICFANTCTLVLFLSGIEVFHNN